MGAVASGRGRGVAGSGNTIVVNTFEHTEDSRGGISFDRPIGRRISSVTASPRSRSWAARTSASRACSTRSLETARLARTSSTPGRTRAVNYFLVDGRYYLVDLPGYGYAKASKDDRRAPGAGIGELPPVRRSRRDAAESCCWSTARWAPRRSTPSRSASSQRHRRRDRGRCHQGRPRRPRRA